MRLSILCVTRVEPYAKFFLENMQNLAESCGGQLVIAVDGDSWALRRLSEMQIVVDRCFQVHSTGYIESVLDEAVTQCDGEYILRLDDDERCTPEMQAWLSVESYLEHDHWKFARYNLWKDANHYLTHPQLWPDHQTRLSTREKSSGRTTVHAGSPHGGGELAPVGMEHHKFIVKSYQERRSIAKRYDDYQAGYGTGGMLAFSLPEDLGCTLEVASL